MAAESTIFILDDDEQYACLLVNVAANAGWQAVWEQSPISFIQNNVSQNDILVLDLNMPEMDGIEVIRALSDKGVNLRLILISGFDARVLHSAKQLAEAHNMKVLASLTKPVAINEFIEVLGQIEAHAVSENKSNIAYHPVTAEELEQAIRHHQLVLYYQPQLDIKYGTLQGAEALVRWEHPERGTIFPDQFIKLAEKNNLIGPLTEEIITIAVMQNQQWQSKGLDTVISINVSADNITSLSLPEQLRNLTDKHAISPKNFTLEITESAVMGELTSSLDVLNRLRMKGFSLAIDDFGTGYSSLTKLYQAPFTELKIDKHFVMRMLDDNEAMVIVKICIMLGHMLGMKLVAEGVASQEIWNKLHELGCDKAQGYFIAEPMLADDLILWQKGSDQHQHVSFTGISDR